MVIVCNFFILYHTAQDGQAQACSAEQGLVQNLPVGPENGILSSSSSELDAVTPCFTAALLVDLA